MDGFAAWLKQLQFDGVWQTAVLVAAAYILAAPVAYYILYAVAAFIAGAAVYFTVKLI